MNYRLTENKKVFNGETLFQIECIEDCKYAKVGELGGYIASYDNLADGAWVNKDVCVCDTSIVKGRVGTWSFTKFLYFLYIWFEFVVVDAVMVL